MIPVCQALPVTEADLGRIRATALAVLSFEDDLKSAVLVPAGALLVVLPDFAARVTAVLEASGHTIARVQSGCLLVSGMADRIALLDAEIERLTAARETLLAERGENR